MKTITLQNVKVEETCPDRPTDGDEVFRLVSYTDDGFPMHELHRAVYEAYDDGSPKIGMHLSLHLANFEQVRGGMGFCSLEQAVDQYKQECEEEIRSTADDGGPYRGRIS